MNDSWSPIKEEMVFLSKEQVLELFKNKFDIIEFKEIEKDGKTGLKKNKTLAYIQCYCKKIIILIVKY